MFSENILVFILAIVDFVLSSASNDVSVNVVLGTGQLWKTLYSVLLEELRGAHLRIAATNFPTAMTITKNADGTFSYSGYAVDACQYMAELFHFNFSFVHTRMEDLVKLGPRETEANFLIRDEADIGVTRIALTVQDFIRLDVSIPLSSAGTALLVPWPDEESRLLAPIRPFQPLVWLSLFLAMVTMTWFSFGLPGLYDKFFSTINNNVNRPFAGNRIGDRLHAIVANITGHSGSWPIGKQLFYRILLGSWCLATLVLVNAYSSLLISYLTIPTLLPVPKNYDDLAFDPMFKNLGSLTDRNSVTTAMMSAAVNGTSTSRPDPKSKLFRRAKFFADRYRRHPEWLFTTAQQRFDFLFTGRFVHGLGEHNFYSLMNELNEKAGYCKITASTKHVDDILDTHYVFLYQKHWRYTDAVRNKMQWWSDTGLAMHWIKKYEPPTKGCLLQDYKKNVPRIRILTLIDLSSAFVILLLGCGVSLLVFLIEKIRFKIVRIRRG